MPLANLFAYYKKVLMPRLGGRRFESSRPNQLNHPSTLQNLKNPSEMLVFVETLPLECDI